MGPTEDLETPTHPGHGHETTDIGVRPLVTFVVVLVASLGTVMLVLSGLMGYYATLQDPPPEVFGPSLPDPTPHGSEPSLQQAPAGDMAALRAREHDALYRYGWVDRRSGIVRIPIDEAMRLVVEKGLPTRESAKKQD